MNDTYELTPDELNNLDIDLSMVKTCKTLRNLAKLNRLSLDTSQHRSGLNKHLFDYITYCGYNVLDYIRSYLSSLQPYMIERFFDQEKKEGYLCVIDNLYKISIYIKADKTQYQEAVISFHENNIRDIAKVNMFQNDTRTFVPIFADSICSKIADENKFIVKAFFQRGLKNLPIELPALQHKDVFIVRKSSIDKEFVSYCNDYIRDLYTSNLNLDYDSVEPFSMLQQIEFTSYGKDTFSSISLLIDSLTLQNDYVSKGAADFALVTYAQNLSLTQTQKEDLENLLTEKYKVTAIKKIDLILDRVISNLSIGTQNNTVKKITHKKNQNNNQQPIP